MMQVYRMLRARIGPSAAQPGEPEKQHEPHKGSEGHCTQTFQSNSI